mmetsp:Transcript_47208/g.145360  ORF Transcript_47208/g.145360 Transcript_47208/m.145360 type:complete len:330 (+) Transcript_47208:306-1295(+)
MSMDELYMAKYGTTDREVLREKGQPLRDAAEKVGISWNRERRFVNTVDSHCVVELAKSQGKGDAMIEEIFDAYFQRGEDISKRHVLCSLAEKVGVSGVSSCLDSGTLRSRIMEAHNSTVRSGITSVPHFTVRVGCNMPVRFSGAQSLEQFSFMFARLMQSALIPDGCRVQVNGKREGEVVSMQGSDYRVKLLDDPAGNLVQASWEQLTVLKPIPPGAEVELGGLSGAAELNGSRGEVVSYHADKGRFEVRLLPDDGSGATKALRADNLTVVRALMPGDKVVLDGLKTESLNGQEAEVVAFLPEKRRFEVYLQGADQKKAIQASNLRSVP